ncbi:uncharacterized protein AC631_01829 [Debaryomyces fabryi]|uniref:Uncharacterized protein n=1 Tax=Debaryomyces fabryi TaxID=58627 RepID=A0A0V1Q1K8_9ASCO|nr:uncharacterized protein AC631_01829 [Debaryomyces fabryi]KSA02365.1 hypothetical protein AC631_01829 [Debaryomyces fabryi]CUM56559.1 unnamed protein product [Debaryomyces fabryi]
MSLTRPKRKATINKSYNDAIDETIFDDNSSNNSNNLNNSKKKSLKRSNTPETGLKNGTSSVINPKAIPYNWQPPPSPVDYFSYKLDLEDAYVDIENQILFCPNQPPIPSSYEQVRKRKLKEPFKLTKGDYIYMISEPPGEPYYIGRIMGFTSKNNRHIHHHESEQNSAGSSTNSLELDIQDNNKLHHENASSYLFQIQWFYRPRDISKSTSDSRLLYASMHTDTCPLQSFRGLVTVKHKQDVEYEFNSITNDISENNGKSSSPASLNSLEMYSQQPNCFYFDKLFDRYMIRFYDILLTASLLRTINNDDNKSKNFLTALNKRFEFIFVESNRTKSFVNGFSSDSCNCEICGQWCSGQDSVTCAGCEKHYHMFCLDPPLLRKPSRGFSWSCAPCTKQHDLEHQSKKMFMLSHDNKLSNEKELSNEINGLDSPTSPHHDLSGDADDEEIKPTTNSILPKYELMAIEFLKNDSHLTFEQRRLKEEWCMRYLGMYSRLEDGVDLDDRSPYPRASTRLGAKHQATNIPEVYDHPIVYYDLDKQSNSNGTVRKKSSVKKNGSKTKKHDASDTVKLPVPDQFKDISPKEYPQWLQPRPKGYIERGVDDGEGVTCSLMWKPLDEDYQDNFQRLDAFVEQCSPIAEKLNILATSPNFVDAILKAYFDNNGNTDKAHDEVSNLTRKSLREPTLSKEEIKRFEAGVKKYGSELYPVYKEVKTKPLSMIVRFYYLWKKSENGRLIWGNFEGRMHKKLQSIVKEEHSSKANSMNHPPTIDFLADHNDDSAYEVEKIVSNNSNFACKHCRTHQSLQWFRITGYDANTKFEKGTHEDLDKDAVIGLCFRCARLWRRYAVVWEDPTEVEKKNNKPVGGWKKKVEFELVRDSQMILEESEALGGGLSYDNKKPPSCIINGTASKSRKLIPKKANSNIGDITNNSTVKLKGSSKEENPTKKRKVGSTPSKPTTTNIPNTKKPNSNKSKAVAKSTKATSVKTTKVKKDTSSQKVTQSTTKVKPDKKELIKDSDQEKPESATTNALKSKRKRSQSSLMEDSKLEKKPSTTVKKEPMPGVINSSSTLPNKRQKKYVDPSLSNRIINPILNSNYIASLPIKRIKLDKKSTPLMTNEILSNVIKSFKSKQLTDLGTQLQAYPIPNNAVVELPFLPLDRKCCVCDEEDKNEASAPEMLICSNCGVNAHISCTGLSIPDQIPRPIKQWLCEPCINDLNPHYSTLYSCCLCLANESNYELSILGHPSVRPDYLKPIYGSGKWCHLVCALFNSDLVNFRSISSTAFNLKRLYKEEVIDQYSIIESIHNFTAIENVSEIYLQNYTSKCGICYTTNGSLIACDTCKLANEDSMKYHITCAQDTPNFKLGFKLCSQRLNDKDNKLVKIDEEYGKLQPTLLCPIHATSSKIYSMRALGKRVYGISRDELKPIIQIYLEDLVKSNNASNKLTGPQLKSNTYIKMIKAYEEQEKNHKLKNNYLKLLNLSNIISVKKSSDVKSCGRCKTTASPMWWIEKSNNNNSNFNEVSGSANQNFLCQTCYHVRDEDKELTPEPESQHLFDLLNEPLDGEIYGLQNNDDNLSDIYTKETSNKMETIASSENTRSRITIGDILS